MERSRKSRLIHATTFLLLSGLGLAAAGCGDAKETEPLTAFPKISAEQRDLRAGERLFQHYCAPCHGTDGRGKGFNVVPSSPKPYPRDLTNANFQRGITDEVLENTVRDGGRGVDRSPLMPAWGKTLNREKRKQIIRYIRHLPARSEKGTPDEQDTTRDTG